MKIRVLLADDQPIIRDGLRFIIDSQRDMEVVGEASDGESAVRMTRNYIPDVILMDIQMPNCTGIEATRIIKNEFPGIKVVLLTTFDIQEYVFDGIRAGAVGYLQKDTETKELLDGIRWVHQGQVIYRTATASRAIAQAMEPVPGFKLEKRSEISNPLTEREIEVLQQMAYGRKNPEIAEFLHVSHHTVKTHVHHILQKLGVEDRTQAVVLAIRQGLVK